MLNAARDLYTTLMKDYKYSIASVSSFAVHVKAHFQPDTKYKNFNKNAELN